VLALWETIDTRRLAWKKLFFLSLGGLPYLIYQYYVIISNPILSLWNVQNQTPSPPAWDLLISFSPALILAVPGAYFVIRKGYTPGRILLAWLLVAFVLLFLPFNLQRRFMTGLFIPVALVSVLGWISLSSSAFIKARAGLLLMTLSLPTILLVLMAGLSGAAARDQRLFRTTSEAGMMAWMADHLSPEEIVLAAPDTGNLIPAWSGQEVVYGHPFETVNADAQKALVEEALRGNISLAEFNSWLESPATYLFWSRREQQYSPSPPAGLAVMHQVGDVSLLKIP